MCVLLNGGGIYWKLDTDRPGPDNSVIKSVGYMLSF